MQGDPGEPVKLPFPDDSFEVVSSIGVLEHVREFGGHEQHSLSEIHRILKPGGHFLCVHLPNRKSWIESISHYLPKKHYHPIRFDETSIAQLMKEAHLELLEVKRYAVLPRNLFGWAPTKLRYSHTLAKNLGPA